MSGLEGEIMSSKEIKKIKIKKIIIIKKGRKNGQTEKPVPSPIKHTTDPSNPGQQSEANGQNPVPIILPTEKDSGNQRAGDLWSPQVLWTAKRKRNCFEIAGIEVQSSSS